MGDFCLFQFFMHLKNYEYLQFTFKVFNSATIQLTNDQHTSIQRYVFSNLAQFNPSPELILGSFKVKF
jgi:hypothetical protein